MPFIYQAKMPLTSLFFRVKSREYKDIGKARKQAIGVFEKAL